MNIDFQNEKCFICEERNRKDKHHMIPQNIKPKNNITVGVCEECHAKLNLCDVSSIKKYTDSIGIQLGNMNNRFKNINKRLDNFEKKTD